MHLELILNELESLSLVLQYAKEKDKTFTDGEKICINQHRAMLLRKKAFLFGDCKLEEIPKYEIPEAISKKIKNTLLLIERSEWKPKK